MFGPPPTRKALLAYLEMLEDTNIPCLVIGTERTFAHPIEILEFAVRASAAQRVLYIKQIITNINVTLCLY